MSSTFGGFEIATRALTAAQKSIDVTGHNIANANTAGYTRQRLSTSALEPSAGYSRFANSVKGNTGGGVEIKTVDQIRSPFLDRQYRNENSLHKEWSTRSENLSFIETMFDELDDSGLSKAFNEFSASIQEASKNPVNKENRTNMMQNALKLTETMNHYATQLFDKQAEMDQAVSVVAGQVNDITTNIADLNIQIQRYELAGQKANDLRDERNTLLDKLSEFVPIEAQENSAGQLTITMKGNPGQFLVKHDQITKLTVSKTVTNPMNGEANALNGVTWEDGTPAEITGGSLKAYLDLRDGNTSDNMGIPYMSKQLDRLAAGIASSFNALHESGWTMMDPANSLGSQTGILFFTAASGGSGTGGGGAITARNITVNPDIVENSYLIALSSAEITSDYNKTNNNNGLGMAKLFSKADIPDIGGYESFFQSFIGEIAVETSHTDTRVSGQQSLVASIEEQRQSVSGVSLDEEMTNLMQYQHSYAAAARMITAIDQMLDVLINKTGV